MPALQVKLKRRKENNMNSDSVIIKIIIAILAFGGMLMLAALLVGLPIMWLWNAILPDLLGVSTVSFWQACGLFILVGILFRDFKPSK
jgi:sterol desaturase/sphingolipid hydroxylase (fatty acid hydroxylase superfamily)